MATTARKTSGREQAAGWGPNIPIDLWPTGAEQSFVEVLWRQVGAAAMAAGSRPSPALVPVLSVGRPLVGVGVR